jgi:hypothetical protein
MAKKLKALPDKESAAITETPGKNKTEQKMIPVRVVEIDYNRFKNIFGERGLALARAGSLALYYVAEQVEAGRLSISKAGIIDRRG